MGNELADRKRAEKMKEIENEHEAKALEEALDLFYQDCARINLIKFSFWKAGANLKGGDARC